MALQHTPEARSYRCSYHPKDINGYPVAADTGVLPSIRVQAADAESAARLAYATTGCVIALAERIEPQDIPATAAVWPFPANGQPVAWTAQQIAAHAQQQRDQLGEALL